MTLSLPVIAPERVAAPSDVVACAPYAARVPASTCVARRTLRGADAPLACGRCEVGATVAGRLR